MRILPTLATAAILSLGFAGGPVHAQQGSALPDIGSSAGSLITPTQESQYGAMYLRELRRYGYVLDDPLIDGWLQGLGYRLAAATERSTADYTFFMMHSRQVNAFATLGGYIGVNAGLVLTAHSEDEVAAVLAHEIAHVTQRHIVRSVEQQQRDQIPILLGMLAGAIAAQSAGSVDGAQAAIYGGMGLMMQRQINHTRSAELEADRLGIQTLARAGFDPDAMATFFGRMSRITRASGGDGGVPDFLRTHPVTTVRISEARDRAQRIEAPTSSIPVFGTHSHPLLPASVIGGSRTAAAGTQGGVIPFEFARERLRTLSAPSAREAVSEYRRLEAAAVEGLSPAQRYGQALAMTGNGQAGRAVEILHVLLGSDAGNFWVHLALAEALQHAGEHDAAFVEYARLQQSFGDNLAISLSFAKALTDTGTLDGGRRAQAILRPLMRRAGDDYSFQRILARASELAGDQIRAGEAHAEAAFLSGRAEDALNQLRRLQQRDDLDYIQRARVDARITAITPVVLEMQRQGIGPDGQRRSDPRSG